MLENILQSLVRLDHMAWYYLNVQWHNPFLDNIIPFFRNPWFWAPLYLFLLIFMPLKFGAKGWLWCLAFVITFALSDFVCASLLKPFFHRLRPCHNPWLNGIVHMLIDCGGQYGFPSNHAANHFSLGIFAAITTGKMAGWVWPVAIFWALLVAYAQVYVGAHFPLDVVCGGLLGIVIAVCTGKIFNRYCGLGNKAPKN